MLLCIQLNYFKDILWFTIWLQSFFCSTNFLFNTKKRWPCQHSTKTANPHLPRVAKVLPGPLVPVVNWIWRHFPPGSFGMTEFSFGKTLNALLLWLLHPVMAFRSPSVVEWSADSLLVVWIPSVGWQAALSFFWHPFCASGHLVIDCEGSRSAHCGPDMHHLEPSHNMMWISWVQLILSFFFFLFLSLTRIKALNFPWNLDPLHHLHTCFTCSPFVSSWRTGVLSFAYVPEIACTPENPNKHISKSTK